MSSHLRVELRSPKRGLDGGYGFDLTKYCASCWSRLGRILKRGARCGVCGRRVCKGCRHFVAAKEWICALCYKKKYTPEDTWHDDANVKRFKGSQGKSGTYLLRLTDWSSHGVLEVHKVKDFHPGRIRTFSNEPVPPVGSSSKSKIYKRNLKTKPKYCHDPVRCYVNYPLAQHDIQLMRWKTLEDAMNPQGHKENHLKYTSVNLKQKRREIREHRATSLGRGRHPDGTRGDHVKKKGYSNRINSAKREHSESSKTLFHDYENPLASSTRPTKNSSSSCANTSWKKEHRRSRKNSNNFSQPAVLPKNEPHMRLSVRGTRIFGRRKSYRAYPTLKGDARANGAAIKCRSLSLPCELSHVESHDYEFWNSGFVQTRVRKLEEELTSNYDDKYSYSHDYEVQSLCSLKLEKILPDGDDYKIAYLSSTSQESSLDYMDDNYCAIGMGTLDVKLNRKGLLSENEDWDLTFSSTEENESSSDDDEFFYEKYTDLDNDSFPTRNYYSGSICTPGNCEDILLPSEHGKKSSNISGIGSLGDPPKSVTQQIHENVDRIFCNVMNYDLDIQHPTEEKSNNVFAPQYSFDSSNDDHLNLSENEFIKAAESANITSNFALGDVFSFNNIQSNQLGENFEFNSSSKSNSFPISPANLENQKSSNSIPVDDFSNCLSREATTSEFGYTDVTVSNNTVAAICQISEPFISNVKLSMVDETPQIFENVPDISISNYSLEYDALNNLRSENGSVKKVDSISKCLFFDSESKQDQITALSTSESNELLPMCDSESKISNNNFPNTCALNLLSGELVDYSGTKDIPRKETFSLLSNYDSEAMGNTSTNTTIPRSKIHGCNKHKKPEVGIFTLSRKTGIIGKYLKGETDQGKIIENSKRENSESRTNSILEVELILYEPLCTPFAEIYFITYGKEYPTKCSYESSIPRWILSAVESEVIVNLMRERIILTRRHLHSSKTVMQLANDCKCKKTSRGCKICIYNNSENVTENRGLTGSFIPQNYDDFLLTKSLECEKNKNEESDIQCLVLFIQNHKPALHFSLPFHKIKEMLTFNLSLDTYLGLLLNGEKISFHCNCVNESEIITGTGHQLSENVSGIINFQAVKNNFRNKSGKICENINADSWLSLKSFLLKCLNIPNDNPWRIFLNCERTNKHTANIPELTSNFRIILNEGMALNDNCLVLINAPKISNFLSSLSYKVKNVVENPCKSYKLLNQTYSAEIKNSSYIKFKFSETHDFYNYKKSVSSINFKDSDIFSKISSLSETKEHSSLKSKVVNYSAKKTHKRSKVHKVVKSKNFVNVNKTWNHLFRYANRSKGNKSIAFISLGRKYLISKDLEMYQQMARNRNYGNGYYTQRETEIANEVPHVGETSESRFAVESQPKPTTSLTGNATFVEYLFLPQLASVRDTTEAHLSVPSIQLRFQSVPAVQRRLVDRESRFAQSGKDRKHGSLCAAAASRAAILTDTDCFCSAKDICVFESSGDGYPFLSNCLERERITCLDHDFEDYVCFGSVPTGLQQLICNQVTVGDINWDNFNLASVSCFELQQNMATCNEDPRLINKVTRTPGRNISKLKKFFDSQESVASDSDITCSKRVESSSISSHSDNVNITSDVSQSMECISETSVRIVNGCDERDNSEYEISLKETSENVTYKSQQRISSSSDIPYCRKVSSSGDLWKNVDIGVKTSSEGLWSSAQNDCNSDDSHNIHLDLRQGSSTFVSSTADLHNLIAASRAELSKMKEPLLSDKSTLENYFTSFENSKPKKFAPLNSTNHSVLSSDSTDFQISDNETFKSSVAYDCDVDEMNFDEEDVTLSDTSSDEEIRCNPPLNTHYLPAYALHTIIEESCEESERDSRTTTPTNEPVTSKLERYFSWDIINDTDIDVKRKEDDDSTVFSDSLSEASGSLNGDANKEIDPTQLASSRLEKYFTSGLVGNENYFYPDDAEFLEDAPVSDFEEDSIHQKISRSALLSSLETVSEQQTAVTDELFELNEKEHVSTNDNSCESTQQSVCDNISVSDSSAKKDENYCQQDEVIEIDNTSFKNIDDSDIRNEREILSEKVEIQEKETIILNVVSNKSLDDISSDSVKDLKEPVAENMESEIIENNVDDGITQKQTVNKEQLAIDVQAIIKKLLMYFSSSGSNSFKHNMETDYMSAWQILETEIERLIQSISPTASLENNSCNSSTIDSNNSDYGSDTIESLDCMTDEDEASDSKNRGNAKYPIVDLFSAAYKMQAGPDFHNINISDETLSIWKRLIQSLQKDSFCMNDNKLYDPNTEARLYIRDQIVNLMHTVTVNESKVDKIEQAVLDLEKKEIASSLIEENIMPEAINEAFNVSITSAGLLTCHSVEEEIVTTKPESSGEEISEEISENLKTSQTNNTVCSNECQLSSDSNVNIELDSDLNKSLSVDLKDSDHFNDRDVLLNTHFSDKINVDEVDFKLSNNINRKSRSNDSSTNFPLFVDIELDDNISTVTEHKNKIFKQIENAEVKGEETTKRSSLHLWVSGEIESIEKDIIDQEDLSHLSHKNESHVPLCDSSHLSDPTENSSDIACVSEDTKIPEKSYRDTGYYSFKSSDDNFLHDTPPPDEFMDVPNFKSLKRSVKKFPLSNTLSKSTNNINQVFSVPDAKFSTLQLKSHKTKGSSNSNNSPSRQFTSLFSPTAVFKKLTGSKGNDTQTPESSIPPKYLKKYARSNSVDSESIIGAISMPQLNCPKPGDSYSALGLYSENDKDSSLIADDDVEVKRYSAYSHSVLSLGSHSASMTSVYSAAACHYGYVTVSGDVLFGLNYNQKSQMMEVFVKQCRNLAAVDARRNKSDPYVKVYLLPDKTKSGKRKTKTKKNALNPVFNELLRFPVLKHELESRTLWLSVWNSDLFGRNDFLGEITLPLGYRLLDSPTLRWYPLQERMESLTSPLNYRGELFLALKYVPRDLSLESRFRPAPVISLRGALHVLVKEARNICISGSGGNLDAFCKSYLLPDKSKSSKQKTPVVKRSRHPKWYYTVIYEDLSVDELKERSLELTVWDHDKITSNEFMGGVRLNIGSGLYHGVSVEWMDARRDESALWQAMLQSPNMWVDGCLPLRPTMQFHHG